PGPPGLICIVLGQQVIGPFAVIIIIGSALLVEECFGVLVIVHRIKAGITAAILVLVVGQHIYLVYLGVEAVGNAQALVHLRPFLGSDLQHAIGATAAIEGSSSGSFQHGNIFDVLRVNVLYGAAVIVTPAAILLAGVIQHVVQHRYAVHYNKGIVITQNGFITADGHLGRAAHGAAIGAHPQTGHLAGQGIYEAHLLGLLYGTAAYFLQGIAYCAWVLFDAEGGNHHSRQGFLSGSGR